MTAAALTLPDEFRQAVLDRELGWGRRWLESLPARLAEHQQRWELTVREPLGFGQCSMALACERAGEPVVLKLAMPKLIEHERRALRHWSATGACVKLLASTGSALLLEHGTPLTGPADPALLAELVAALHSAGPAPAARTAEERLVVRFAEMRRRAPASSVAVDIADLDSGWALACELLESTTSRVLLHGDIKSEHLLASPAGRVVTIDPHGFVGDPALDVAVAALKCDYGPSLADRVEDLAMRAGADSLRCLAWARVKSLLRAVNRSAAGRSGDAYCAELLAFARGE